MTSATSTDALARRADDAQMVAVAVAVAVAAAHLILPCDGRTAMAMAAT
jgi:hypothetical protein